MAHQRVIVKAEIRHRMTETEQFLKKIFFPTLVKNIQMQGTRNPEE
jgi:hypothetical protein